MVCEALPRPARFEARRCLNRRHSRLARTDSRGELVSGTVPTQDRERSRQWWPKLAGSWPAAGQSHPRQGPMSAGLGMDRVLRCYGRPKVRHGCASEVLPRCPVPRVRRKRKPGPRHATRTATLSVARGATLSVARGLLQADWRYVHTGRLEGQTARSIQGWTLERHRRAWPKAGRSSQKMVQG